MKRWIVMLAAMAAALAGWLPGAFAEDAAGLYRVTTLRAAPGEWRDMRALIEGQGEAGQPTNEGRIAAYRIRHSQGAQWDFMLIQPVRSMERYFSAPVQQSESGFREALAQHADFSEDWFVHGPAHEDMAEAYPQAGMFLVEMFRGRAGMVDALEASRHKENLFLAAIDRPENFVFRGIVGADWDVMTIGLYESLAHYGEPGVLSSEDEDRIAREVGYEGGVGDLSPGLRELLTQHSDTIAVAMD